MKNSFSDVTDNDDYTDVYQGFRSLTSLRATQTSEVFKTSEVFLLSTQHLFLNTH
ncbi:hypothetical protein [Sphingobacterium wenxiniae]|uniref:Uncharacterized protein n=1 Tax=Sphingobacterium wenxiniae TaxID=683125 RepID=A0A1I6R7M2_9SPHI|nr:hypothetical protein [Sphingobacterium wenxiniae]SFS60540.1 hypothetical protein SAMN05660206_103154 [Sphingobacterium wenxiniae]